MSGGRGTARGGTGRIVHGRLMTLRVASSGTLVDVRGGRARVSIAQGEGKEATLVFCRQRWRRGREGGEGGRKGGRGVGGKVA